MEIEPVVIKESIKEDPDPDNETDDTDQTSVIRDDPAQMKLEL